MSNIIYSKQAKKALEVFDKKTAMRIKKSIDNIPAGDIKRLEGNNLLPLFRLRVGKYRIIYLIEDERQIKILKIDTRGDVYK